MYQHLTRLAALVGPDDARALQLIHKPTSTIVTDRELALDKRRGALLLANYQPGGLVEERITLGEIAGDRLAVVFAFGIVLR